MVGVMTRIAQWLNQNLWLNLAFLILALLSILVSIALYIMSKKEKSPWYTIRTFQLVEDKISKIEAIEIFYRSQKVDNLSLSKVALWNRGKGPINSEDVAPKDPIRIEIRPECKLLAAEILYKKKEANNFTITPDLQKGEVKINFDYFHKNEGLVIQIYHTGKSNHDIVLRGTIKGVSKIAQLPPGQDPLIDSFTKRMTSLLPLQNIKPLALGIIIAFPVSVLLLPVYFPLFVVDTLLRPVRKVPRDFGF